MGGADSAATGAGAWLLVIGMHRSGTSAMTGALVGLGFGPPRPDDRMDWPESNPEHWESFSLTVHDDAVLKRLGASWDAPPEPSTLTSDEFERDLEGEGDPASLLNASFDGPGPWVWKDPRTCLLLPYWKPRLSAPLAAVLVWREPQAVATSLHRRDGMDLVVGVALWERYNRAALTGLDDVPTFITSYEELLGDPGRAMTELAEWCSSLPQFRQLSERWDVQAAVDTLAGPTATSDEEVPGLLLPEQVRLRSVLTSLRGTHDQFGHVDIGPESLWTSALLRSRREYRSRELETMERTHDLELSGAKLYAFNMEHSTSWRVTRPLRSILAARKR